MNLKSKKRARPPRVLAVGLGVFVVAGVSLSPVASSFIDHAHTLVFAAVDPNCQAVEDASKKQLSIPYRMNGTSSIGTGPATTIEGVAVEGTLYSRINGQWISMPLPSQKPKDDQANNEKKNLQQVCQRVRDESVDGEDAAVYSVHSETERGKSDRLMWISSSRALPLRMDIDITSKSGDKSHLSIRYDYKNVQKPKF